jgi:hypothetical protein
MCEDLGLDASSDNAGGSKDVAIAILVCGEENGIKLSRRSEISVDLLSPRT